MLSLFDLLPTDFLDYYNQHPHNFFPPFDTSSDLNLCKDSSSTSKSFKKSKQFRTFTQSQISSF